MGQELVARTHHRGVIRKRVLPLKFLDNDDKGYHNFRLLYFLTFSFLFLFNKLTIIFFTEVAQKVAPGSVVADTSSGKKIGTVNVALGSRGLGLMRLEEALKKSNALAIQGSEDVKVVANRPKWWPDEWFSNELESIDTA